LEKISFINTLSGNPLVVLLSIIMAIIAIVIPIVLYFKSKKKKSISYNIDTHLLDNYEKKINGITIKYSGEDIERISVTNFLFSNDGTETIHQKDISYNDKFSIRIKDDFNILNTSIIDITNEANDIKFSYDKKEINIDFEYIDKGDSFKIQIFHTGRTNKDFDINGYIIGFGRILKGLKKETKKYLAIIIGALFFLVPMYFIITTNKQKINILITVSYYVLFFLISGISMFFLEKKGYLINKDNFNNKCKVV
jgi:hypothetical protein